MHRSLALPRAANAVLAQASTDLLFSPIPYYDRGGGEIILPPLASAFRGTNLTPNWLRYFHDDRMTTLPTLSPAEYNGVRWAAQRIFYALPNGVYNPTIQHMPLLEALQGVMSLLARPVFRIESDDWRADRASIIRQLERHMTQLRYPEPEEALEKLSLAKSYSRAEYYLSPEPRIKLTNFTYWSSQKHVGYRHNDAIRRVIG